MRLFVVCCGVLGTEFFGPRLRPRITGKGVLEKHVHCRRYGVFFCCFACAFCLRLATSDMTGVFVCVIVCMQIKPFVTLVTLAADYMDKCFGCVWCCVCGCCVCLFVFVVSLFHSVLLEL